MQKSHDSTTLLSLMLGLKRVALEETRKTIRGLPHCSFIQFEALSYVKEKKSPLTSEVARHFLITPPAATFLTNGLVKSGLLERKFDLRDRRAVHLVLTKKGENMLREGTLERTKVFQKVFSVLSLKEKSDLSKILKKVAKRGN